MRYCETRGSGWLIAAVLALCVVPATLRAQGAPGADQMKAFQSLPQDQRDALMQQLGLKGGQPARSGSTSLTQRNDIQVNTSPTVPGLADSGSDPMMVQPKVKGGETLLIDLRMPTTDDATGAPVGSAGSAAQTQTAQAPVGGAPQAGVSAQATLTPIQLRALNDLRERVQRGNPYVLSADGLLRLPGLAPIALLGLTELQIQQRLALDPSLHDFTVGVNLLKVEPRGVDALKPFGYEMFKGSPSAFVPGTDIPVPEDYRLGPGDVLDVQLYGQKTMTYTLPVSREGTISLPELGPIAVQGKSFGAASSLIQNRVSQQLLGTQVRISLSELKTVRVLLLGDAERPGSYVVNGLSSVVSALFAGGGVKPYGSLRAIEVKRGGRLLRRLDLYDVLLRGDTTDNIELQSGDAVFVPPVGPTIGITGAIQRPAIYELNKEKTLGDLVSVAGGLSPNADPANVSVERVSQTHGREVITVDLLTAPGRAFALHSGDVVSVSAVRPIVENGVTLEGDIYRPRTLAFRAGMRLSDVLPSVDELRPTADHHYILVRREAPGSRQLQIVSADLDAALAHRGSDDDIALAPRDRLTVFELQGSRDRVLMPLLDELRRQSGPTDVAKIASVVGSVNSPGKYPLEPHMRVSDLLRAGGGLQDAAYPVAAELTRYSVGDGNSRHAELFAIDLTGVMNHDPTADVELHPYDVLNVKETPEWRRVEEVELRGEVRFPGVYQIRRGETLSSVVERAGGLTPLAFAEGAVFTREELRKKEREQLDKLSARMKSDLATLALQTPQTPQQALAGAGGNALSAGQTLLDQLHDAKPVGRLVIDLDRLLAAKTRKDADVTLRNNDLLVVPRITQEVSVLGEVQSPTSHLYRAGLRRDDYVALSGGLTARADRNRIYVVRANGSIVGTDPGWFRVKTPSIEPGDTIVAPYDAEKMRPLPLWTAVTTIIYNLAVATAAIARF